MPSDWPAEALKAQAVARRSYAVAQRVAGKTFDVYADVRSQVYGGVAYEKPSTTAAVRDTAGETVLYDGKPATTYFFSTSGGKDGRCGRGVRPGAAVPRVRGRPVRHALALHQWGPVVVDAAKVASAFKAKGRERRRRDAVRVRPGEDGDAEDGGRRRHRESRRTCASASGCARPGSASASSRSAARPRRSCTAATVRLAGTVRGVAGVALAARAASAWLPVKTVPAGQFSIPVSPRSYHRLPPGRRGRARRAAARARGRRG
jgi:hypothetical protein